ncbi:putative bifunctional diguanylate cyclase/phosphodiesterase [Kineococcus glutinatus]|uniref:Diguanylate cyclase (GGDEF)-like protein n=1 Tax=Kineococcus glutinatus TaxID=1070872 RepID=A0ABP9H5A0_9ACTN
MGWADDDAVDDLRRALRREQTLEAVADALERLQREEAGLPRDDMSLPRAADAVADVVREGTGAACSLLLRDEESHELQAVVLADAGPGAQRAEELVGLLRRAAADGDFVTTAPAGGHPHVAAARVLLSGICRGVLVLHHDHGRPPLTEADLRLARALADRLALYVAATELRVARRRSLERDRDAVVRRGQSAPRLAEVLDALPVQLVTLDADGRIELVNRAIVHSPAATARQMELLQRHDRRYADALRTLGKLTRNPTLTGFADGIDAVRLGRAPRYEADVHAEPDGTQLWWHVIVVPHEAGGGVIITHDDVTERRRAQAEASHRATHDALTGLPNRTLLSDRLEHALARAARHRGVLAVVFIDLDHFKLTNDTHGHGVGDELLVQVVRRLSSVVRPEDTLARFGGDEFVLLCEDLDAPEQAERLAGRLLRALDEPLLVAGRAMRQGASMGVAIATPGVDASTLLAEADAALFEAKERGRGRLATFDEGSRRESLRRLDVVQSLQEALAGDELELHFQPIVALPAGGLVGVESLLRWRRGGVLLGPGEFLDVAESLGLTLPIGRWVLRAACAQAAAWRGRDERRRIFVNVSSAHLAMGLEDDVRGALDEFGLDGGALGVEITETTLMRDPAVSIRCLHHLRDLGVTVEVDDFGTGYSSLAYLKALEPQSLKIDRTFVAGVHRDERDRRIVQAVISLASSLGIHSTAEGIESVEQLDTLIELGCDAAQGYLLQRPAPAGASWPTTIDLRRLHEGADRT